MVASDCYFDLYIHNRATKSIPPTWGFVVVCFLLRSIEGVGTAMFFTAVFSTFPKLFPGSVSILMVREMVIIPHALSSTICGVTFVLPPPPCSPFSQGLFQMSSGIGSSLGRSLGGFLYTVRLLYILRGWIKKGRSA